MGLILPRPVRNREIMFRALEGQSAETIAEALDISPDTVKTILTSPLVKQEMDSWMEKRKEDITERVKNKADEALEVVTDVMRGDITSELRLKAAKEVLDRDPRLSKQKDLGSEFATGLGESIIRTIAKKLVTEGRHDVLRKVPLVDDQGRSERESEAMVPRLPDRASTEDGPLEAGSDK